MCSKSQKVPLASASLAGPELAYPSEELVENRLYASRLLERQPERVCNEHEVLEVVPLRRLEGMHPDGASGRLGGR